MKKVFVLVITFLVIGLAVAPQVQAQSAADLQAADQLTKDFQAGKITVQEFQRRMEELVNRMGKQGYQEDTQQTQQQRQQSQSQPQSGEIIRRTYPGATAGWPSASTFRRYGKTVNQPDVQIFTNSYIRNPHSLTFSHRIQGEKLTIYVFRNFISGDSNSMARADESSNSMDIEFLNNYMISACGGSSIWEDPTKTNVVPTPSNRGPLPYYTIEVSIDVISTGNIVGELIYEMFLVIEITPKQSTRSFVDKG